MKIKRLFENNIGAIMEVEQHAFISPIRTTEANFRRRLAMNHVVFGAFDRTRPIGTIAFRCGRFSPQDYKHFPKTFKEYAEEPNERGANAAFVYTLGVIPKYRNRVTAKKLIQAVITEARRLNLYYVVGDSRCPSYNGSVLYPEEQFERNEEIHRAIQKHLNGGPFPENEILLQDHVLGFYLRTFVGKALWIIPNFWPGDEPCGNFMVIIYTLL